MPLEKQYDRIEVLEKATHVFWTRGYEATSISDLVEATRLNRGSLYTAFNGKRGLFIECLTHYDRRHRSEFLEKVSRERNSRDAILAVFEAAAHPAIQEGLPAGCLLVNSALEVSPHDPAIRTIINNSLSMVEAFFKNKICVAQAEGCVSDAIDPEAGAKLLLGLFLGLRVLTRSEMDQTAVSAMINHARIVLT